MTNQSPAKPCPDADSWSHIQETITMLCLAVCQIEASMSDSHESVNTLTQSFTDIADHSRSVDLQVQSLQATDELVSFKQEVATTAAQMHAQISKAITAFQFYDRVSQRLDHVARSLEAVTSIMTDNGQLNNPLAWQDIQQRVKNNYTMEAERIMFEHIMRGASVEEALQIYRHHFTQEDAQDDIDEVELF